MDKGLIRAKMIHERGVIKAWFKDNDWKVNKVTVGEWETTDPRWIEYKEQRAIKRARLDEIMATLGG